MKYRKKPVVIDAIQWNGVNQNEIAAFMRESKYPKLIDRKPRIESLEGCIYAKETDYIIRGVQGEFYPCDADIFEQTYEPAD